MGISDRQAAPGQKPGPGLTGEAYHAQITRGRRDRQTRARFQYLIGDMLKPGAEILDFGAGTGIDAHLLAGLGHRVQAFEPDLDMRSYLERHCASEIHNGRVKVISDIAQAHPVDAVIANFAVFNLVPDRAQTFRQLHGVLRPGGFILASLLNPWSMRDARHPWWRRNLPRLIVHGDYAVPGASGDVGRTTARAFARLAAPWFDVARVEPAGLSVLGAPFLFVRFDRRPC